MEASDEQRAKYEIGIDGDDIHWDEIDEDIHISSFFDTAEPDMNNPIADIFHSFPQLNVSEVGRIDPDVVKLFNSMKIDASQKEHDERK